MTERACNCWCPEGHPLWIWGGGNMTIFHAEETMPVDKLRFIIYANGLAKCTWPILSSLGLVLSSPVAFLPSNLLSNSETSSTVTPEKWNWFVHGTATLHAWFVVMASASFLPMFEKKSFINWLAMTSPSFVTVSPTLMLVLAARNDCFNILPQLAGVSAHILYCGLKIIPLKLISQIIRFISSCPVCIPVGGQLRFLSSGLNEIKVSTKGKIIVIKPGRQFSLLGIFIFLREACLSKMGTKRPSKNIPGHVWIISHFNGAPWNLIEIF